MFPASWFCVARDWPSEQEDSTSESVLISALPEALQFEVTSEDDILENEANIPVHENIASTAEGILEDKMTGRVQGAPLNDEQEVEEEEEDQQPPNRPQAIVKHYNMYIAWCSLRRQICLIYRPH